MNFNTFFLRIIICFILSILIGLERQYRHKLVGLRTNVLVSLGAFMFVAVSFGIGSADYSRIAAQVVSGIGFLGAGVILRDGSKIKGLNTAATLWCVSAIGVLCAAGMIKEASVGTLFVLLSNVVLRLFSIKIMEFLNKNNQYLYVIRLSCLKDDEFIIRNKIVKCLENRALMFKSIDKYETDNKVNFKISIVSIFVNKIYGFINDLSVVNNILNVKWCKKSIVNMEDEEDLID